MSYDDRITSARPGPRSPAPSSAFAWVLALVGLAALAAAAVFFYRGYQRSGGVRDPEAQPREVTPRGDLTELEKTNIRIYKEARVSVVHITTLAVRSDFYRTNVEVPEGTGSGFLWDDKGHVVTNYHVIKNADAAKVTLSDQSTYKARYVGGAAEKDLAVLFIDAPREKLRPIALGTSEDLQ